MARNRTAPGAGLARVAVATVISAAATWLVQAVAGRTLSPLGFVDFMTVWGMFFALLGLLQGIQQEVTRAVSSVQAGRSARERPLVGALRIGVCGGLLLLVSGLWWGERLLGPRGDSAIVPLALAVSVYSQFNLLGGGLAGRADWVGYARLILLEGLARCVLVVIVILHFRSVDSFAWALTGGGLSAALLLAAPRFQRALTAAGDTSSARFVRGALNAMLAAGCSALTIAGFPFLLKVTADSPLDAHAGVIIAAVIATRAPLLITLNAYQGAAIARFVREGDAVVRYWLRLSSLVAGVAVVGAAVSFLVGPTLLRLIYGPDFVAGGTLFSGLVLTAGLMSILMLSGAACVAMGLHRVFAAGWVLTSITTVVCLSLNLSVEARTMLALTAGPLVGLGLHATLMARHMRRGRVRQT